MAKKATVKSVEEKPAKTIREQIAEALVSEVVVDDKKLDRKKFPDLQDARNAYVATEQNKRVAKLRAGGVAQAFKERKVRDPELPVAVGLPTGQAVYLGHVREIEGGVEVWLGDNPNTDLPPAYRIFNPPTLTRDPLGDVEIVREWRDDVPVRVEKYREDPLAALATVVASDQSSKKGARR